jgi:hypothetical protein
MPARGGILGGNMTRREWLTALAAPAVLRAQDGFTPIFDGKSLAGWTIVDGTDSDFYVADGAICVGGQSSFPAWLRSEREYENFELRGEFFIKGWTDSGIYLRAPEHGRPTWAGYQIKVFHQKEAKPTPYSVGAVFPLVAPKAISVRDGWNDLRAVFEGARLRVWINSAEVQDVDTAAHPELKRRLRHGYLGIAAASAPCRFRALRVKELPGREPWISLYEKPEDYAEKWTVSEGQPGFLTHGGVLRGDGAGHLATKERFRDFELEMYVRASSQHNGGVLFRSSGRGLANPRHYEIQLHNVEEAHFPTGSLYHIKRAAYPRIEDGKWYLFQLRVQGPQCEVRINGDTVMEYGALDNQDEGFIELQTHRRGFWTEFKTVRVKRL